MGLLNTTITEIFLGKEACNPQSSWILINLDSNGPEIKHFVTHQIQVLFRQGGVQTPKIHVLMNLD